MKSLTCCPCFGLNIRLRSCPVSQVASVTLTGESDELAGDDAAVEYVS